MLAAAEDIGIWSAAYDRYVLRRHAWPSGAIADSIIVDRDWFPGPGDNEGNLFNLHADGRGLIWVPLSVADPEAPGPWSSPGGEERVVNMTMAEISERIERYTDIVIEALTPEGDLVASARFASYDDAAQPIHDNLWYRASEDDLSIIVLEALLVEHDQDR